MLKRLFVFRTRVPKSLLVTDQSRCAREQSAFDPHPTSTCEPLNPWIFDCTHLGAWA